ncbi:MAG TPA: P63C domain-containing protein [Polyangiaceae bacterium]|nr:P63C domain-containing protein [Polyangiaceae bacterium]
MADRKKQAAGRARWAGVEKSERKALVSKAAHARWKNKDVVLAKHKGTVKLGALEFGCAVLSDGRRVLSERSISVQLGHRRHPDDYERRRAEVEAGELSLPVVISPRIRPFLSATAVQKLGKPIRYQLIEGFGIPAFGVEATLLADICEAFLAARDANVLLPDELPIADSAYRLMRALARVAIDALIDEATGYQVVRDRDELQRLLEKYVSEEFRPWNQFFPDEFYIELFRLRGITTDDVRKRPAYFGHLTNDIVYERLVPGMLPKLQQVNPSNDRGRRARAHTQHLNSPGADHLRKHLTGVVMLMKASANYADFKRALDRAAPKQQEAVEASADSGDEAPAPTGGQLKAARKATET